MNIFATFQFFQESRHATIYTVTIGDESGDSNLSEYDKFLTHAEENPSFQGDLAEIAAQIDKIVKEGVSPEWLRPETLAKALPGYKREIVSTDFIPHEEGPLRLYCVLLPDDVTILCGGAQKTASKAQDCPNVFPHFKLANHLARKLKLRLDQEPRKLDYEDIEQILKERLQL